MPLRCILVLLFALGLAACAGESAPEPRLSGLILDAELDEVSGLAPSRHHADTLWVIEDGGNGAVLHAVGRRGGRRASLRLEGVANTDWEDLARFDRDGRSYLLVADVGDNGGLRRTLQLHAVVEPLALEDGGRLRPAWSLAFRWPDGPRDCEAMAVDAERGQVLLISKRRRPPELFVLPLRPHGPAVLTARRIARLGGLPAPDPVLLREAPTRARTQAQVTAADLSPDGRTLAVLTYRHVVLYARAPGQPWAAAVRAPVAVHPLPGWMHQAEALAWARNGRGVYVTGEFSPAPLLYLALPKRKS
ncbi:hypothetical protein [Vulcaniibacterium gelatinicum]|uniref:hypothetical protein n=1 Tax=Vulcaniibacterium gelatinicum TaxID=2598725 RepID=UPI0011CAF73D|nr:hypothetical protein [Vulcaniibacterium gelatinicum]